MAVDVTSSTRGLSLEERRARNREEMRAGILAIAREIMREQGTAGLNLNEIARRMGVKAPALYTYFPGKAALYDELYRLGIGLLIDAEVELRHTAPAGWERIERWFELRVSFANSDPDLFHLIFDAPMPGFTPSPESLEQVRELYRAISESIADVVAAGVMHPSLSLVEVTDLLISMRLGIVASHVGRHRQLPTPQRLDALVPSIVEVLKAAWEPRNQTH